MFPLTIKAIMPVPIITAAITLLSKRYLALHWRYFIIESEAAQFHAPRQILPGGHHDQLDHGPTCVR